MHSNFQASLRRLVLASSRRRLWLRPKPSCSIDAHLATKQDVAELKREIAEVRREVEAVRAELTREVEQEIAGLQDKVERDVKGLEGKFERDLKDLRMIIKLGGLMVVAVGVVAAFCRA